MSSDATVHSALRFATVAGRGRSVFATTDIWPGTPLISEVPLLSMPLPESRATLLACERCCRPVGTVTAQLQHLTGIKRLPELPLDDDDNVLADNLPCRSGGMARYCSEACATEHAPAQMLICGTGSAKAAAALARFEAHALETFEVRSARLRHCGTSPHTFLRFRS